MKESPMPPETDNDSTATPTADDNTGLLPLCNRLLTTLLDDKLHSHNLQHIQSFRGKWSLLRTKLSSLRSLLADFVSSNPSSSPNSNPLFLDLLSSLSETLSSTLTLADKCRSHPPNLLPDGKLRTHSDLDSLLAIIDRHLSDSTILLRSGVLHTTTNPSSPAEQGIVGTAPPPATSGSNKREAVRAETRNLLTRLQIGSSESKSAAMDKLLSLLHDDDKNVMIAVAQGVVPVLIKVLDTPTSSSLTSSTHTDIKDKSVAAIARISTTDGGKHVLISTDGHLLLLHHHLLRVLDSGSGFAKEKACTALQSLTAAKDTARAVGTRSGISSLLEICHSGTPSAQAAAAGVLRNLAQFDEITPNFLDDDDYDGGGGRGAVSVLVSLAASGTPSAQENAIGCLANLTSADEGREELKALVVREGVIDSLNSYWDSTPVVGPSLEPAVRLLRNLASSSYRPIPESLVSEGFVARIAPLLGCGVLGVRIAAAGTVYEMAGISSRARKAVGEAGCVPPLTRMLDGKAVEERVAAAKALSRVLVCEFNRKVFKEDERGIVSAVLLLDPSLAGGQSVDRRWVVAVLGLLVKSKRCRKEMVAAGACVYLRKLVEMEVEGAKKLLECLGSGRLWGVFSTTRQ